MTTRHALLPRFRDDTQCQTCDPPNPALIPADQLAVMVRAALEESRVPLMISGQVKASYGCVGSKCEICGHEIQAHQVEYEVTDRPGGRPLWLHLRCHVAWQVECANRGAKKA